MTGNVFLIRVQDHSGALERVLGTLRRKYLGLEKISVLPGPRGTHEVLIRIAPSGAPPHRVKAELESLVDVREVRGLGSAESVETREMAVVRVSPGSGPFLAGSCRLIGRHPEGDLLEITGAPHEVDAALADLAKQNVVTGVHRTGEVLTPPGLPFTHGEDSR